MTMKNKETLEKLRTYQIGVIRSVITSRQGRLGTYQADATDRERLADTDDLAYEEYYESPLTIKHDGLYRNVISLEFCEDGLTPVCLMDGWDGDDFPLPLENLSCDTLQGIVEWLEEYDFIPSAEAAPQTTSDLTADFVECSLPEYPTRYDVFRLGELQNFLDGHESPEFGLNRDEVSRPEKGLQKRVNLMQQKTNSDLSRHYLPRQLRHLILQEYLSGVKTARQLSEEHGIPMSTIHKMGQRWKAKNSCSFVSTPNPYPIMSRVTSEEASELLSENKALRRRLEEALLRLEGYEIMGDILQEEYGIDLLKKSAAGQSSVSKKDTQQ